MGRLVRVTPDNEVYMSGVEWVAIGRTRYEAKFCTNPESDPDYQRCDIVLLVLVLHQDFCGWWIEARTSGHKTRLIQGDGTVLGVEEAKRQCVEAYSKLLARLASAL